MGTDKLLKMKKWDTGITVIVCPPMLVDQWTIELRRFLMPQIVDIAVVVGGAQNRIPVKDYLGKSRHAPSHQIVIISTSVSDPHSNRKSINDKVVGPRSRREGIADSRRSDRSP